MAVGWQRASSWTELWMLLSVWQRVEAGLRPRRGSGVEACSGCKLEAMSASTTLAACQAWVKADCQGAGGDLAAGCPFADALDFGDRVGEGITGGVCRAWQCGTAFLSRNNNRTSDCYSKGQPVESSGGSSPRQASASTSTKTSSPPSFLAENSDREFVTPTGTVTEMPTTVTTTSQARCSDTSGDSYRLDWLAAGRSFFWGWDFLTDDSNKGASQYLTGSEAFRQKVVSTGSDHAIMRLGSATGRWKRATAKIRTKRSWKHFLAAIRFTRVPVGCGIWPAFWTNGQGGNWPNGGELNVMEYVNHQISYSSLHTGTPECKLEPALLNRPGCKPFPDVNGMGYDCTTKYPERLGCAPNSDPQLPMEWNQEPVSFVIEWTAEFIKIFKIPDSAFPADLANNNPKPQTWDEDWLVGYYPLARSPGCAASANRLAKQQLILNIGLCGEWAGKVWADTCSNVHSTNCRAVDPLLEHAPEEDCCTQFVSDPTGKLGGDEYLSSHGVFNISWVKVFVAN